MITLIPTPSRFGKSLSYLKRRRTLEALLQAYLDACEGDYFQAYVEPHKSHPLYVIIYVGSTQRAYPPVTVNIYKATFKLQKFQKSADLPTLKGFWDLLLQSEPDNKWEVSYRHDLF